MAIMENDKKNIFTSLNAEDDDQEVTEIESLCMNCQEQGITRLFLTKIPFFREVIISSFTCEHCNTTNSELQPASTIQEKGSKYAVKITSAKDLDRQVVLTNTATTSIPELEFESPPNKGVLTTVEGLIDRAVEGLTQDQVLRRIQHPEVAEQIDQFVARLVGLKSCASPFHVVVDDPSGNSFIENPHAPHADPETKETRYTRTVEQDRALGIQPAAEEETENKEFNAKDEVLSFPANCPNCGVPCTTNMKLVDIPHFKQVVIMATTCDACGCRENEVKAGSGIEPKGTKITLELTDVSDLSRDILKSDMCCVSIPELEFSTMMTSMPGKFTTVEGLIGDLCVQLRKFNPFLFGDSSDDKSTDRIDEFCAKLDKIKSGEMLGVTIEMDDPTGNSYLQNLYAPDPDPEMTVENYERTHEQNEDLGLNQMKTENYESS